MQGGSFGAAPPNIWPLHAPDLVLGRQPVDGLVIGCRSSQCICPTARTAEAILPLVLRIAESLCWPEDRLRSTCRSGVPSVV